MSYTKPMVTIELAEYQQLTAPSEEATRIAQLEYILNIILEAISSRFLSTSAPHDELRRIMDLHGIKVGFANEGTKKNLLWTVDPMKMKQHVRS